MRTGTRATGLRFVLLAGCLSFATMWVVAQSPAPATATYVGSAACGRCHAPTFERWKRTRMANVVRDPREHPEAIVADFTTPDPLLTFTRDQVAFVYGSKFKQRYFTTRGRRLRAAAGDVGRHASSVAGVWRDRRDQRPVRRVSLGQLRRRAQDGDGMERRLRAVPRAGQRSRRAADGDEHRQSRAPVDRGRGGRLRPMPLGRPSACA